MHRIQDNLMFVRGRGITRSVEEGGSPASRCLDAALENNRPLPVNLAPVTDLARYYNTAIAEAYDKEFAGRFIELVKTHVYIYVDPQVWTV